MEMAEIQKRCRGEWMLIEYTKLDDELNMIDGEVAAVGVPAKVAQFPSVAYRKEEVVIRITITAELIKEEEGGCTVYCPELDTYTQGEDVNDASINLQEAAELHIEEVGLDAVELQKVERRMVELEVHT